MIRRYTLILLSLMFVGLSSCTQNDGHIGSLFGVWRLTSVTADGVQVDLYDDDDPAAPEAYEWCFQGNVIKINELLPHHDLRMSYGIWSREGDKLLLDFSYGNNTIDDFTPPAALHLVEYGVTTLTMTVMTSDRMAGWYVADDGVKYEYTLSKFF